MNRLPSALGKEPLIDAVFEMRFSVGDSQLADVLPGYFFHHLRQQNPKLSRLGAGELPPQMRAMNPNLKYAPVQRIDLENYSISIGDQNIVVHCSLPYPKWNGFRSYIISVVDLFSGSQADCFVERYSLKFVNLIPAAKTHEQVSKVKMTLSLGGEHFHDGHLNMQVHKLENDFTHIISIITNAVKQSPTGETIEGIVLDIDSIVDIPPTPVQDFASELRGNLDNLRAENKTKFFACLTEESILEMEPTYD